MSGARLQTSRLGGGHFLRRVGLDQMTLIDPSGLITARDSSSISVGATVGENDNTGLNGAVLLTRIQAAPGFGPTFHISVVASKLPTPTGAGSFGFGYIFADATSPSNWLAIGMSRDNSGTFTNTRFIDGNITSSSLSPDEPVGLQGTMFMTDTTVLRGGAFSFLDDALASISSGAYTPFNAGWGPDIYAGVYVNNGPGEAFDLTGVQFGVSVCPAPVGTRPSA